MRKLLMLVTTALAAIAFGGVAASSASAEPYQFYTSDEETFCPAVSEQDGEVSGGCLIEDFDGGFEIGYFTPAWTRIGSYNSTFDLVVDVNGDGYAVNPTIDPHSFSPPRIACTEADGSPLPWTVNSHHQILGVLEMDITINIATQPGGGCTQQTITVQATSSWGTAPTDLDQETPSANINNASWHSNNALRVDWGG